MSADELRRWTESVDAWRLTAGSGAAQQAKLSRSLLDALAIAPDHCVVDLSSGVGEPALTMAALAARVIAVDPVAPMLAVLRQRAADAGLANTDPVAAALESLPLPGGIADGVCCRFGLMFVDDLAAAAREIARVLKPGGRFAAMVWGPRGGNAGWQALADCALPLMPEAEADLDSPFRLANAAPLLAALTDAGLAEARLETLRPRRRAAPQAAELEDLVQKALARHLGDAARAEALRAKLSEWLALRAGGDGLVELPVSVHLVTAQQSVASTIRQ